MKNDCNRCKKVYELPTIQSKKIVEIIYYGQSEIEGIQSTGQIFFLGYLCNRCEKKVMADIKKICRKFS